MIRGNEMISMKKMRSIVIVLFLAITELLVTNGLTSHAANATIESIDTPAVNYNTAISSTRLHISGWALSDIGVKQVEIFVDNKFSGYAAIGQSRPDVAKFFSNYSGASTSGYSYELDVSQLSAGNHKLTVKTTGNNGTTAYEDRNFLTYTETAITDIDVPSQTLPYSSNQIQVAGWSLNPSGVKSVQIYCDNNFEGQAQIGQSRPDVQNVFNGYSGANISGYSYTLDGTQLSSGSHIIKVVSTGNDGSTSTQSSTFSIKSLASLLNLDAPTIDTPIQNLSSVNISGWALNGSGIASVTYSIDNGTANALTSGLSRPDVAKYIAGNYQNKANSGYSSTVNLTSLTSGSHTLTITAKGNDGSTQSLSRIINVAGLVYNVDTPVPNNQYLSNSITVAGWAIDPSGISKIQVYVDGNYVKDAAAGQSRLDLPKFFPNYKDSSTSGYNTSLDISSLSNGSHKVTLKFIAVNGDTASKDVTIQKGLPAVTNIDTPKGLVNGSNKTIEVSGWALNSSGIKQVNVLVDNKQVGVATTGDPRPDVLNVFTQYTDTASGYHYNLDVSSIGGGNHTITVQAVGNDGSTNSVSSSITRPVDIVNIDSPQVWQNVNNSVNVAGWSLDITGIKEVDVLVDGQKVGVAAIGISRTDVAQVHPDYNITNSGFSYNLDVSKLTNGDHTITVNSIGNSGQTLTGSVPITVGTLSIYKGADVYEGDNISDYQQFRASGVQVVIQKATQGETFVDSLLQYRASNLTAAGFKVGYYHYANNDSQPDAQAQHFLDAIKGLHSDTVLWLDIENEGDWNKQQAVAFTKEFISYVQARGYKIGVYSGMSFYNDYLADSNLNVPIWLASYGRQPSQYPSVSWQYTDTGTISGVTGYIDLDWFNSSIFIN